MMKSPNTQIAFVVACLVFSVAAQAQEASRQSATASATTSDARPAQSETIIPRLVKFGGTLLDAQEHPLVGPVGVTFSLYAQQTGGAALWMETQNVKPDANGAYTVLLGAASANGLPTELFVSGEARWLGIQVGQQPEHERVLLVSVPYAVKAGDAETLGGLPASAFVTTGTIANTFNSGAAAPASSSAALASSQTQSSPKKTLTPQPATACTSLTSDGTATGNSIALFTTACNIQSSVITQSGSNVGFGTATPAVAVDVVGNNAGLRLSGTGTHQVTVTGASSGRLGQDATGFFFSSDTNGKVIKFLTNNGALNEWMRITSAGNVGIGTQTPAAKLDVHGNLSLVATASGVTGISVQATDLASANTAVNGLAGGAGGSGVIGEAENGSLAVGVWGISSSGVAGQFSGDVNVTGNISKSGGSFKIDHPMDPTNKFLYHSFVESPDMKNIYDGIVNLNEQGEAVVQLPSWFEVLNRDFRYQLTAIGGFAPVYIAEEISGNRFKIAGGKPGMKVSWMVTGIRQDAWANAHRIPVEEEKPALERGYYLHPELYGQPSEKGLAWIEHPEVMKRKGQSQSKSVEPKP